MGDWLFLAAVFVVTGVLGTVWLGGWLAAVVSGQALGVGYSEVLGVAVRLPGQLADPRLAWPPSASTSLPGPLVYWPCTALAASPVVLLAWLVLRRWSSRRFGLVDRTRLGVSTDARLATPVDLEPLIVASATPGRFILGTVHEQLVATEAPIARPTAPLRASPGRRVYRPARGSVMLVGPSQCGKSTCAICMVLALGEHDGPVLLSSVKTDLLDETFGWRARVGECKVFDPTGITGLDRAGWTPLRGAYTVTGAQAAARALVDCAPRTGGDGGDFWFQEAEMILAGYLWVAANACLSMRDVVRWVFTQDAPTESWDGEVKPLLMRALTGTDIALAQEAASVCEFLEGVWRLEDRMRSSVFGTAQAAVWPWTNPDVVASSLHNEIDLDWLLSGPNTLYACAPLRAAKRLAPALGGLIGDILEQVAERVARSGRRLDPPLLVVLDEVGNTPLRDLPELVSTLAGLGVQIVTIWQSVAQVRACYREHAGTIIANHRTKVFYSGISDPDTFDLVVRLVGDEQIVSRQLTTDLGSGGGGRQSLAESTIVSALVPAHVVRQQPSGSALLIHGTLPPAELQTRSQFEDPVLFERASIPLPASRSRQPVGRAAPAAVDGAAVGADGGLVGPLSGLDVLYEGDDR